MVAKCTLKVMQKALLRAFCITFIRNNATMQFLTFKVATLTQV